MTDSYSTLQRLDKLAALLDARWKIPGTDIRFGLDSLIGLIPGIGDAATALISLYLMGEAKAAGASNKILGKMAFNIGLEFVVGLVPVIGDLFDIGWRANQRNMALLRREIAPPPPDIAGKRVGEDAINEKTSPKGWFILLLLMAAAAIAGNHYGWYSL
jgi:hypothetical protein